MNARLPGRDTEIVASVSGGKDSTALLLHLRERGLWDQTRPVFFDTGWEHPLTYEHLGYLEQALGIAIERRAAAVQLDGELLGDAERIEAILGTPGPSAFVRVCLKKGIFPRRTVRFCTQDLKVAVAQAFIREVHERGAWPWDAVGIRAAESRARSTLDEFEVSLTLDCMIWRPLIRWTEDQVIAIHQRHNVRPNPLYLRGATRVGCWPCIMAGKAESRLVGDDEQRMAAIRELEAAVRRRHAARAAGPVERPPTLFTATRREPDGSRPGILIDEHIAWARTPRGGEIGEIEERDDDADAGCMRWGMCEQAQPESPAIAFEETPIGLQGLLFPRPEPSPAAETDASSPGPVDASGEVLADASVLGAGDASSQAQGDASRAGEDDASPPATRACSWCRGAIPAAARRDALHCSVRCRQATHRFRRQVEARAIAAEPRRLAVADPPYPGLARRYYEDHPDYGGEVDHAALVRQLVTYDGWALATSSDALPEVLALARAVEPRVRVASWVRGGRRTEAREPVRAWEPVLYVPARADVVRRQPPDTLVWHARPRVSDPGRVIGAKPARWWSWVFGLIGAAAQDELHDLFPGSGGGARAWEAMQRGVTDAAD